MIYLVCCLINNNNKRFKDDINLASFLFLNSGMESLPYFSVSHKHHDDMWCMVSPHHQLPICIACIIERLGNHSLSTVEKQFNLSTLASIQNECDEVTSLLQQHPLVCQHIIDIITGVHDDIMNPFICNKHILFSFFCFK